MAVQFASLLRAACLDAIESHVGTLPTLEVYTGSSPGVSAGVTGTLLVTLTAGVWSAASGGTKSFALTSATAVATGTPGYARLKTSGGTAKMDVDCGVGSGSLAFASTVASGGIVSLSSWVFTGGNP